MFYFLGILSGLVFVIGDIPYILDTIKGKTKPHRISWLIFAILNVIYLANQIALGAKGSLILVCSWTLISIIIFSLSIKKGVGGSSKLDIFCLLGAVIGLVLWWLLKSPLASVIANILVSLVAYIPTFKKAYLRPQSETRISWFTASVAALLGIFAVGKLDVKLLILPTFSLLMAGSVSLVLYNRTRHFQQKKH